MKRLIPATLCLFLLAACEPPGPSQYLLGMQQYQNQTEEKVIDDLGPPDRNYEIDGVKYLTYTKATQQIFSPQPTFAYGIDPRSGVGVGQSFNNDPATVETFRCDVFFAIKNKRVIKVGHRGNAC
jgi:hypothetical protein